jgi:GNAT superfamily N-acetyltransferase
MTTRELADSDLDEVLDLMRISLGETALLQRTSELFAWKHFANPFGRSITLVAEADRRIVGLRTFMRWHLDTVDSGRLRCVRAVDTATHPDYQRMGIFRRLTEEAVEVARAEGVDMVFNTPNERSKPGYLKMGWNEVGPIGAMVRPSFGLLRRGRGGDDPYVRTSSPFRAPPSYVDRPARGLRTPRTSEYLDWRFASHPTARYDSFTSLGGTAVVRPNLRNGRRELVVADLLGSPSSAMKTVRREIRSAYAATWFSKGSPEWRAAKRAGFVTVPGVAALTLVMRPLHELSPDLRSLRAWDVAVSDLELL